MDNNVLANDKLYAVTKKSSRLEQTSKPNSESGIVVTLCLSSCDECNGRYEDNTGKFKIQCRCNCHDSLDLLLEENKKSACLSSSENKQWDPLGYFEE
jgi:hypothetical protein